MKKHIISYICILFAGITLDIIGFAVSALAYINILDTLFSFCLLGLIIIGCVVSVITILHNKPSFGLIVKRCFVLFVSSFVFIIINGYTGITRNLYDILNPNATSSSDNASGILLFTYISILIIVNIITIAIQIIRGTKTGDGSVS